MAREAHISDAAKAKLDAWCNRLISEAAAVSDCPELQENDEEMRGSIVANVLIRAAAISACRPVRKTRRPQITRFLNVCRYHFALVRDAEWKRTTELLMRWVVEIAETGESKWTEAQDSTDDT